MGQCGVMEMWGGDGDVGLQWVNESLGVGPEVRSQRSGGCGVVEAEQDHTPPPHTALTP